MTPKSDSNSGMLLEVTAEALDVLLSQVAK